jgi:hypothetical protein
MVRLDCSLVYDFLGSDVKKDIQNCGKNFPVNKAWVPAFAGMTP